MATAAPSPAAPAEFLERRTRLSARAAVLFVLVLIVLAFSVAPLRAYLEQKSRIADLELRTAELELSNLVLAQRVVQLQGPKELERIARECLGYVRPGETPVILIPEDGSGEPPDC